MSPREGFNLWLPFVACSLATIVLDRAGWRLEHYWMFLTLLGTMSLSFGVRVLRRTGIKWVPTLGVLLGLVVGQWWLVQFIAAELLWQHGGFGP